MGKWSPLKPERLVGHFESYEGYDDTVRNRPVTRALQASLNAALQREALMMGAAGLTLGLAIGVALMMGRNRR